MNAPDFAVHKVTADGGSMDGLASLRIVCKAAPFEKLVSTITADLVAVSHVSGSHQLERLLHEVITSIIVER